MLPEYSPSPPAPAYSLEPSADEQQLELAPRQVRNGSSLSSTFIKRFGKVTLVLHDQEDDVRIPSYERNSIVRGSLCFDDPTNITDVIVKVRFIYYVQVAYDRLSRLSPVSVIYRSVVRLRRR
jgi:hypothetical protein